MVVPEAEMPEALRDCRKPGRFRAVIGFERSVRPVDYPRQKPDCRILDLILLYDSVETAHGVVVAEFARLTRDEGWHVRFIELMPVARGGAGFSDRLVPVAEIRARVEALGPLTPAQTSHGAGPASYFTLPGANGTVGFIGPVTEHFCRQCNRLRLTADGNLRPCLLIDREIPVRQALRDGKDITEALNKAIELKPEGHELAQLHSPTLRKMAQIGG